MARSPAASKWDSPHLSAAWVVYTTQHTHTHTRGLCRPLIPEHALLPRHPPFLDTLSSLVSPHPSPPDSLLGFSPLLAPSLLCAWFLLGLFAHTARSSPWAPGSICPYSGLCSELKPAPPAVPSGNVSRPLASAHAQAPPGAPPHLSSCTDLVLSLRWSGCGSLAFLILVFLKTHLFSNTCSL